MATAQKGGPAWWLHTNTPERLLAPILFTQLLPSAALFVGAQLAMISMQHLSGSDGARALPPLIQNGYSEQQTPRMDGVSFNRGHDLSLTRTKIDLQAASSAVAAATMESGGGERRLPWGSAALGVGAGLALANALGSSGVWRALVEALWGREPSSAAGLATDGR